MKKRKWILPVSIILGVVLLCVVSVIIFGILSSNYGFDVSIGKLYILSSDAYIIDENNMSMKVVDFSKNKNLFNANKNGDKIILLHGPVEGSYPSQAAGYLSLRLSEGDSNYKPSDYVLGIEISEPDPVIKSEIKDFNVQYIRTNSLKYEGNFPIAELINSSNELNAYYTANKEYFDLEQRDNIEADNTIGFLNACNKYDKKFFENNSLIFIVLEEGSGSIRHNISKLETDENGIIYVNIESINPEIGTCDMACWHIIIELPKDKAPKDKNNIDLFYNGTRICNMHSAPINETQATQSPVAGYCGNTMTTIYFQDNKSYSFMFDNSVTVTDMLAGLIWNKGKICRCTSEYKIDTEIKSGYQINLTKSFVRCDEGQADLTNEQAAKLKEIILWAEAQSNSSEADYPSYSFNLTWNTYGISSYDSESSVLIKSTDATNPRDYETVLKLNQQQYSDIWNIIKDLDLESYPDEYNPHKNAVSSPYMTLILSVKSEDINKTVTVKETVASYQTNNKKGQKFLDACKGIVDIITNTKEWKALPEYEFYYD